MGMLDISFRQIRYFVCTAELGQVSLAAQELNITQSAITIAIRELENKLNAQLFIRAAKGMTLTEQGKLFLNHCYDMINSLNASQNLQKNSSSISGELRIGASYTVLGYYLPSHIQRLQNMYPNVLFKIVELSRTEIEAHLINGELDIAVLLSSNVNHPELTVRTFLESPRTLWVGNGHPVLQKASVDYADIIHEPYIMLTVDEAHTTTLRYWQKNAVSPNVYIETSSVEAVRSIVANGNGICILSNIVYRPWSLEGKRINRIKLVSGIPTMNLGVAWKTTDKQSQLQKVFVDYFLGIAQQQL